MEKKARKPLGKPGFDILAWRSQFPVLERTVPLANCSQSPQSLRVRKAVEDYLDDWKENPMNWEKWMADVASSKQEFARLINGLPGEVSFHTSASQAIVAVASALDCSGKRNKVVVSEADFPTMIFIWKACRRLGVDLGILPAVDGGIDPSAYERAVDERTLITCVPQVYYQNGFRLDIAAIAGIAHNKGSLVFVDAYQGLGIEPVDVRAMGIDFLVSGNLKYLLGMPGSAYLYVREELIPGMNPTATGWLGQENPFAFQIHDFRYAPDARRFDTGTPNIAAAYAAMEGMRIINEVGVANIKPWIDELSRHALREIETRGLETTSPRDVARKGAITSIAVPSPQDVEMKLRERGVLVSARGPVIRLAHHFFVTPDDIDRALDAIEEIVC